MSIDIVHRWSGVHVAVRQQRRDGPDGSLVDLVVTIQPGEMVFTQPAPLTFPNTVGWAPGFQMV